MNLLPLSIDRCKLSASSGFFVGTRTKLVGRARVKHLKRMDDEITIEERFSALCILRYERGLSLRQVDAIRRAETTPITNSLFYFPNHMTTTIKSLVRRGILVPVISDEEYEIQLALGVYKKDDPRFYELNAQLINSMVYESREQDWLDYTE